MCRESSPRNDGLGEEEFLQDVANMCYGGMIDCALEREFEGEPAAQEDILSQVTEVDSISEVSEGDEAEGLDVLRAGMDTGIRQRYLGKLAYHRVWSPQAARSPRHQTCIIFDYDDTLVCTSWLNARRGGMAISDADQQLLSRMTQRAKSLLEMAARCGQTYIVTNAAAEWVRYSAALWAPELLPVLQSLPVISARDRYQSVCPGDVAQWKLRAFLALKRELDPGRVTNLIALGDSEFEMEAARIMAKGFPEVLLKTVKFQPVPTPLELVKELDIVSGQFERIVTHGKSMKITLRKRESTSV